MERMQTSTNKRTKSSKQRTPIKRTGKGSNTLKDGSPITISIPRRFTHAGINPVDEMEFEIRGSKISNPDGSIVFEMKDAEVPKSWSQLATDIAVSKYFRKAGVPGTGHEKSVKQLVYRIARTIREHGYQSNYFSSVADADSFEAELTYILLTQRAAFNSPVWFNCGLYHRYGILGQRRKSLL